MIIAYTILPNILLRVTPTAKRNTYSVATPYYIPRVEALHASTLGWEIATPTELPLLTGGPSPALPKGREPLLAVFKDVWWRSFSLEKAGMGLLCWPQKHPSPVSLFVETGEGLVAAFSLPLGRVGEGLLGLLLSLHLCSRNHLLCCLHSHLRNHLPLPS